MYKSVGDLFFRDATLKRKPHEHKQDVPWNVKGQQLGRNRLLHQVALPSLRTQAAPGEEGRKTVKGMTWNGYKWLVPTNKTRDFWMVKQSK